MLEFAFALSMIALHLSTWAEEWILWATSEFSFLKLPEAFCTGSSIMPQKVNPDVLELIRGKTARVVGNLQALDDAREGFAAGLQPRFAGRQAADFRFVRHGRGLLGIGRAAGGRRGIESPGDRRAARPRASRRHDADGGDDPPRNARSERPTKWSAGSCARRSIAACGFPIWRPANSQMRIPSLDASVKDVLGVERAIERFTSYGSTAPAEVERQIVSVERETWHPSVNPRTCIMTHNHRILIATIAVTAALSITAASSSPQDEKPPAADQAVPAKAAGESCRRQKKAAAAGPSRQCRKKPARSIRPSRRFLIRSRRRRGLCSKRPFRSPHSIAPDLAKQFLDQLLAAKPDGAALADVARQFGSATLLQLASDKALNPQAQRVVDQIFAAAAAERHDAARLAAFIKQLSDPSPEVERDAATALRDAGARGGSALARSR